MVVLTFYSEEKKLRSKIVRPNPSQIGALQRRLAYTQLFLFS